MIEPDFYAKFAKIFDHLSMPDDSQEAVYERMAEVLSKELVPARFWTPTYMRQIANKSGAGKNLSKYITTAVSRYYDSKWGAGAPKREPWADRRKKLELKAQLEIIEGILEELDFNSDLHGGAIALIEDIQVNKIKELKQAYA